MGNKRLIVMRHAKSSWKHPELDDSERPLNKRGLHDAPMMGQRLAQRGIAPDLIVSSPAVRALATARAVAEALDYPISDIRPDEAIYLAGVGTLVERIRSLDDRYGCVMLFGHNPGFTDLVNELTDVRIDNLPTAGVVAVQLEITHWVEAARERAKALFVDYPKNA